MQIILVKATSRLQSEPQFHCPAYFGQARTQRPDSRRQSRGLVAMVTNLPVGEDAALGQPQPEPGVRVVHLDGLCQTVERLFRPAGVQEGDARVVDQLVVPGAADRVDGDATIPVT